MQTPYSRFEKSHLILRDELAIDRTLLANERTILAYLRSGVALILAGITILHFSHQLWYLAMGVACLPVGVATILYGTWRFRRMQRSIAMIREQLAGGNPEGSATQSRLQDP